MDEGVRRNSMNFFSKTAAAGLAAALILVASPALAADPLDGANMSLLWSVPFLGILLSIALAALAVNTTSGRTLDTTLNRQVIPVAPTQAPDPLAPAQGLPGQTQSQIPAPGAATGKP